MNRAPLAALVAVVAAAAVGVGLYLWKDSHPPTLPPPAARVEPPYPPADATSMAPVNPLPAPTAATPLPPLKASDDAVRDALAAALPPSAFERLVLEGFVRHVVATVDNLPREVYAQRLSPVQPVPGLPKTTGRDDTLAWSSENDARYAPYMAALEAVDTNRLVDFYLAHYPLFQDAYVELGYPKGYFNDRLVAVIDHLLATPQVEGPLPLVQPKVLYEYANPELQQRSAGQKAMIRIGSANAAKVKAKLREIRARIAKR